MFRDVLKLFIVTSWCHSAEDRMSSASFWIHGLCWLCPVCPGCQRSIFSQCFGAVICEQVSLSDTFSVSMFVLHRTILPSPNLLKHFSISSCASFGIVLKRTWQNFNPRRAPNVAVPSLCLLSSLTSFSSSLAKKSSVIFLEVLHVGEINSRVLTIASSRNQCVWKLQWTSTVLHPLGCTAVRSFLKKCCFSQVCWLLRSFLSLLTRKSELSLMVHKALPCFGRVPSWIWIGSGWSQPVSQWGANPKHHTEKNPVAELLFR